MRRPAPSALLAWLALLGLITLLAAGAWSLATGRAVRDLFGPGPAPAPSSEPGLYRVHADPLVSYVLQPDTDRDFLAGRAHGDALGLRARAGPPRGTDPLRIAVTGDSVAFGYGLHDDETIAHRLELELQAALPPGGRAVECRTVAVPGWNQTNSVHALLDHLDALDPDIVVFLPVGNDLFDSETADETGHLRAAPDPASDDPWLIVSQSLSGRLFLKGKRLLREAGRDAVEELCGPQMLTADLTAESARRYDRNVDSLALLARTLAARGGHLLVAPYIDGPYVWHLLGRCADRGVSVEVVPLFATLPLELRLPDDPHPNAEAAAAMARWIAADLLQHRWLAPVTPELPRNGAALEALRAPRRAPADVQTLSKQSRGALARLLRPLIDVPGGEGCQQILGGVHTDHSAFPRSLFALPRAGPRVELTLAPLPVRADLYPLTVRVELDGAPAGTVVVPATGEVVATFDVPPARDGAGPFEVRLIAESWAVVPDWRGEGQVVSFRPLQLRCAAE